MNKKQITLEDCQFKEAKRQIMELCVNAYKEGKKLKSIMILINEAMAIINNLIKLKHIK